MEYSEKYALGEEEYSGLMETLYLQSIPGMREINRGFKSKYNRL